MNKTLYVIMAECGDQGLSPVGASADKGVATAKYDQLVGQVGQAADVPGGVWGVLEVPLLSSAEDPVILSFGRAVNAKGEHVPAADDFQWRADRPSHWAPGPQLAYGYGPTPETALAAAKKTLP